MKEAKVSSRRSVLKAAGAGLVAAAIPSVAAGALKGTQTPGEEGPTQAPAEEEPRSGPKPVYLYGCGWNHDLPGVFGEVCLTFDMRADVSVGTGLGTFRDDVHPEVNSQFQVNRVTHHGKVYTFEGEVISSRDPSLLGMAVSIVAEKTGNGLGKASITVGSEDKELVVIAIIAILIGMLLPADLHHP